MKTKDRVSSPYEVARLFWSTASNYVRRRILLTLTLIVISATISALAPVALKFVVDGLSGQPTSVGISVLALVTLYIVSQWLGRVLGELRTLVHGQADRRLYRALSSRVFNHVIQLPFRFHVERETGAVNETLSNGLQGFNMVLQTALYTVLPVLVQLCTVAFVLTKLGQPFLLVLFVIALVCYAAAFTYGTLRITTAARGASVAQIEARSVMTDSIMNYETIKLFTAEPIVRERLDGVLGRTEAEWLRFYKSRTVNGVIVATIFAGFLGVTILYATSEVLAGRMTIGTFVLVSAYMIQLVAPIEQIGVALQALSQGYAFLERMLILLRETPENAPQPTSSGIGSTSNAACEQQILAGALAFENVSASYGVDRRIMRDISFHVLPGRTLAIVGSSGAGKTSIIRLLLRFYEPTAGRILVDGMPISSVPLEALRSAIAVVPQDTALFNETIGYNIGLGRVGSTRSQIERAARIARLHDFICKLPNGYDTKVGERGLRLSGGERQRVAIARAALKEPAIYVFDEATSSLDSRTEQEILTSIRELSRNATTLIIAHRLSTAVHADEIIVLDEGAIVERGTHAALLDTNGRYAAMWHAQQLSSTGQPNRALRDRVLVPLGRE